MYFYLNYRLTVSKIILEKLKYPIGKTNIPNNISSEHIKNWMLVLEEFPQKLENLTINLSEEQLETPYREKGWTIRQVIHHCYDSHHNSYTRFKWTLTENEPVIKAYFEERWAEIHDTKSAPILLSLNALKSLHAKWVYFLKGLSENPDDNNKVEEEVRNEVVNLCSNFPIYKNLNK